MRTWDTIKSHVGTGVTSWSSQTQIYSGSRHTQLWCLSSTRNVPAGPLVSRSRHSFVFNEVVGLDLFFLNTYEKHTLPAMNIVRWVYWFAACCSSSRPVGRDPEERIQKLLVTFFWKGSHPCCRPTAQLLLWHIWAEKGGKRWDQT